MMKSKLHPAWIVAGITFATLFASAGFRSAPSVLILPLEDEFGWRRDVISAALAINVLLFGLTAPFAAALMDRFTVRKVVMSALSVIGIGALLTIWMNQSWHLMLLWGVVVGIGTGSMALVFAATIANRWFVKKRGLIIGVLTAAGASGQLVFLPTLARLAQDPGWRASSVMISIAAFLMVPLIYLFLKENPQSINTTPYGAADNWQPPVLEKGNAARVAIVTLRDAAKVRNFWYLVGSFFICGLSTSGLIGTHFIPAAHDHGMAQVTAASLLALIGVFDVVGTITSGYLTDRIDPRKLLFFYYLLRGLSLFLLPSILFSTVEASTLVFVIFYGLDWIATVPPTVMLCRQVLGPDKGAIIYGWVFAAHQIGGALAAFGAGLLRVKFGDYAAAFYITGILCVITSYFVLQITIKEKSSA
ncbi:MAG: MFS transporter [Actinobacteria bacterium BACL4 MAG-120820-bin23]|nr:MAG: MFS transporter [Actinobacteria bacterium BACL4 MAG-121022-bin9]KRO45651.1 MAG: MFS transporter [Actinobacteria bacterium BACL4 MAG-120813-bin39]KRO50018.1 MAG: MFS transporter [Actinobacteria bacterium BACL4 MAG-120820-bin23]KRO92329.1 MAG: MFS transporter [Actinobacteria bacterium BACL4 MAG-120507-bin0]HCP72694.1 MFS transporter [Actinomycetota bacterium]